MKKKISKYNNTIKKLIIFLFLLLISCKFLKLKPKIVNIKYREKNPIEILNIHSLDGDIDIIGWAKDLIEIDTKKTIFSGLANDLNLMDTMFEVHEKELIIKIKKPVRIDGKIDLKIYIPYILLKIYIDSKQGDIIINKYLGDVEIKNIEGNINFDFQGNILRIKSYKSKININVASYNSCDMIINNEEGDIKINIDAIGKSSYLDVKSINSNINLNIVDNIDHKLFIYNENKKTNIYYDLDEKSLINEANNYLTGKKGKNYKDFILNISNINGKILLQEI